MENQQIVDSILETVKAELQSFVEQESKITSSIEYEERILSMARTFSLGVIQGVQGKLPKSRNLKKKS